MQIRAAEDASMTFDEIIQSFARSKTVPVEAIQAALAAPEAFVDEAIPLVERIADGAASRDEEDALAVVAHVLGEIGDERAFAPLVRVLLLPREEIDPMLGDLVTESLGSVLNSVAAANDAAVLEEALEDADVDEFVRATLFETWTYLVLTGKVPRERARAFLSDYPVRVELDTSDFGWSSWVDAVTALGFAEMTEFARRHLRRDADTDVQSIIDKPDDTIEDFERELSKTLADPDSWKQDTRYQPFTDTIAYVSQWHMYSEEYRRSRKTTAADEDDWGFDEFDYENPVFTEPAVNPFRDVGRNDPCPCGSGKKFKKCCLNKEGPALD
jgi:uncharacterized protein